MLSEDLIKNILTISIAVLGWIIGHYYSSKRDKKNKRREIITNHLIEAYRILANDITRRKSNPELDRKLEYVIAEIQLFGSKSQVELAKKLAYDVAKGGTFYVDELLNNLRDSLRKELELSEIKGNITWLRVNEKKEVSKLFNK